MNWGSILRTVICCVILVMLHYTVRPLLGWRAPIDFMLIAALFGAVRMRPGVAAFYGLFLGLISDALAVNGFGAAVLGMTIVALGTLIGPTAAGFAFDASGSYTLPILAAAAANAIAAAIVAAAGARA